MLKTGSINSATRTQPETSEQTARDENCVYCIGEQHENRNRTVSEEMLDMVTDGKASDTYFTLTV